MTTPSLRLPEPLLRQIKELARREGISINEFLITAAAEKISALTTEEYLEERAGRGRHSKFKSALRRVPRRPPAEGDELDPSQPARRSRRETGPSRDLSLSRPDSRTCRKLGKKSTCSVDLSIPHSRRQDIHQGKIHSRTRRVARAQRMTEPVAGGCDHP